MQKSAQEILAEIGLLTIVIEKNPGYTEKAMSGFRSKRDLLMSSYQENLFGTNPELLEKKVKDLTHEVLSNSA